MGHILHAGPFQLRPHPRGRLDSLSPRPVQTSKMLAPGKALLAVSAVGLNFRDVLNVLGMYPGDPGPPGVARQCSNQCLLEVFKPCTVRHSSRVA